ncbi:hypothetical protein RVIR1_13790 [Candidatus Rickettsiella viridis]|uniref:Uncharacterized protein n=1 Tax=Candidatus Rickettsiella viridis TaxID=676208 RepID=A0A2Z5UWK3_9COXI|nr:hypothetical protein RVIR1_13790 [Candidatus Rickettsiella viridis]
MTPFDLVKKLQTLGTFNGAITPLEQAKNQQIITFFKEKKRSDAPQRTWLPSVVMKLLGQY